MLIRVLNFREQMIKEYIEENIADTIDRNGDGVIGYVIGNR